MKHRHIVLAAIVAACAPAASAAPNPLADGISTLAAVDFQLCPPNCNITARVDAIDIVGKTCKGAVVGSSPGPGPGDKELWLIVPARRLPPNQPTINWTLDASRIKDAGVAFSANGVDIKGATSTDFDRPVRTATTFQWSSLNTRLLAASYDVMLDVTPTIGAAFTCTLVDPVIINRGN